MDELIIGGRKLSSRFLLGTGQFRSEQDLQEVICRSGS